MKKILMMIAVAGMSAGFAACGNKTAQNNKATDSESVASNSVPQDTSATGAMPEASKITNELGEKLRSNDPKVIASVANEIKSQIKAYMAKGDVASAQKYASQVQAYLNKHAAEIKKTANGESTLNDLETSVANLPTNAEDAANEAGQAVKSDAENAANNAVNSAKTTAENAKTAATNKANAAKQAAVNKANNAVNSAHKKASDAVNKANKKANDAVNDATNKAMKGLGL